MSTTRIVYVSDQTHRRLKQLAARRGRTMGAIVEELVEQEAADLGNVWTTPEGLLVQQGALGKVWEDPSLDVYNTD
jgi:predicted DNA-binding protein